MAIHCGWLFKKGALGAFGERRRFFELNDEDGQLNYFKTEDGGCMTPRTPRTPRTPAASLAGATSPRTPRTPRRRVRQGFIRLGEVKAIDDSQVASGCFDLITRHRVYELRAEDAEDARDWINGIRPFISTLQSSDALSHAASTYTVGQASTLSEPLLGDKKEDVIIKPDSERSFYQPAVPWCVETVWVDEHDTDAPLDITADLGAMPEGGFKNLNVMLSDGTKLALSQKEFKFLDGGVKEVADAGESVLLAQLVKQAMDAAPVAMGTVEAPASASRLHPGAACAASAALGLAAARIPVLQKSLLHSSLLGTLLLLTAAVCIILDAMLGKTPKQYEGVSEVADMESASGDNYKLRLRAVKKKRPSDQGAEERKSAAERSGRLSHPERLASSAVSRTQVVYESDQNEDIKLELQKPTLLSQLRDQKSLPDNWKSKAVIFSGKWKLNLQRSDDPSEMLKAMGVPLVARAAIARCSRTVTIEQDGLEWTETMATSVVTKTVTMTLDNSPYTEMSPVDKTSIMMRSQYEEDGKCVVTRSSCSDGIRTQVVARCLIEDGKTYHTINKLTVKGGKVITTNNYFDRLA